MKIIILIMVFTYEPSKQYAIASVYASMNECIEHSKDYRSLYPADAVECIEINKKEK